MNRNPISRNLSRVIVAGVASFAVGLGAVACGSDDDSAQIANPASVFCVEQGGEVVIEDSAGGEIGFCEIGGERIEEWEYYRANHDASSLANPAAVFCAEQGGETVGPEPMCILADGTEVDAWEYFRENN